uniref:Tyrosine--tRNA ligase n=2 Tax=Parascaris univalens TaxID=6257 RepID=A0A915BET1_PARUN
RGHTLFGVMINYTSTSRYAHSNALLNFCADLSRRQLVAISHPPAFALDGFASARNLPNVIYAGFDPTSESLHVGNLLVATSLLRGTGHGCRAIAVVGGATALVGDPSGRDTERLEMAEEVVKKNAEEIRRQMSKMAENFYEMHSNEKIEPVEIIDNTEWHSTMTSLEFMRICRLFRVGDMLRLGAVKSRMRENHGLPCSEFLYQIMQSYDWYQLSQKYNCYFQIGGSDQLGHLDAGYDYIRLRTGRLSAGICLPLITDASGRKLGKSVTSAKETVWLSEARTSPYAFYQFFRQQPDKEITPLIRYFSLRPLSEIEEILSEHNANLGKWVAQEQLAEEMTRLVHGRKGLDLAQRCSRVLFKGSLSDIEKIPLSTLEELFGEASVRRLLKSEVKTVGDLADRTRSDKIRGSILMKKGALLLNGQKFVDPEERINFEKLLLSGKNATLVCWGRRKYQLIRWID